MESRAYLLDLKPRHRLLQVGHYFHQSDFPHVSVVEIGYPHLQGNFTSMWHFRLSWYVQDAVVDVAEVDGPVPPEVDADTEQVYSVSSVKSSRENIVTFLRENVMAGCPPDEHTRV